MKTLSLCLIASALVLGTTSLLEAQAAPSASPDAPAPAAPPADATQPPAEPAAPQAAAPATAVPPAIDAPAEPLPDPSAGELERQRVEADRARIRILLARARAERDGQRGQAPAPAPQPEPVRYGDAGAALAVAFSVELPWNTDTTYDLFRSNDVGRRFGMWATYDLLALADNVFLGAGGGFDIESTQSDGLFNEALDSDLTAVVLYATSVVRYVPVGWLQPHARVSLGGQFVRSQLDIGGRAYNNDADLPFGSLGAGFTLRTPTRFFESRRGELAALSFGVMVEGGYTLAPSLEMNVDGRGPDDRDIPLIESELGELDRSGPFMRVSLVGRFY